MSLNTVRGVKNIGAADAVTKAYIRKNEVFADAFNYFMYDGEQKIQPDQLRELDTTEIAILLNEKDTKDNKTRPIKALFVTKLLIKAARLNFSVFASNLTRSVVMW